MAHGADLVLHNSDYAAPVVEADPDVAPEPPPIPELASPPIEAAGLEVSDRAEPEAEPLAFEADAEIAFEPAVEFAFDEAGEPSFDDAVLDSVDGGAVAVAIEAIEQAAPEEPAGTSMFDATYMPPAADDTVVAESQFDVRPPTAALDATPASFFDASQSESYGEPPAEAAVAFEAEDGVMFEAAFEGAPAIDDPAVTDVAVDRCRPTPRPVRRPRCPSRRPTTSSIRARPCPTRKTACSCNSRRPCRTTWPSCGGSPPTISGSAGRPLCELFTLPPTFVTRTSCSRRSAAPRRS